MTGHPSEARQLDAECVTLLTYAAMTGKPADDSEQLLSIRAAADLVGVHPATLRRWADAGRVPVLRSPTNQRKFRVTDLRKLNVPEQRTGEPGATEGDEQDDHEAVGVDSGRGAA